MRADLAAAAGRPAFDVEVAGLRSLGGGVAFDLPRTTSAELRTARLAGGRRG